MKVNFNAGAERQDVYAFVTHEHQSQLKFGSYVTQIDSFAVPRYRGRVVFIPAGTILKQDANCGEAL
jgi:hypothetical protein